MVKAVFVTYLIALTICVISAYKQECAIGPQYWCQSFQNAQDCGALRHCTDTIWRYDERHTNVDSSTKCEWCQKIVENTHKAIQNVANNEELIKSTLINGCQLLPLEDISSNCINVIENYESTVLSLMKNQRYETLCHLMEICPSETKQLEETHVDEQSKMLCNVIVRATHELHVNQQKTRKEIQTYLKNDCQKLTSSQLVDKCGDLIERRGNDIYAHVVSNVELSKVCDYMDDSTLQSVPQAHCELCTFVLAMAKQMLDAKQTEDKVLIYIDEQVCSRLTGIAKKTCKQMIDSQGRDLINNIQSGTQTMLLCTHLQLCQNEIVDQTSPIRKDEMRSFLLRDLCGKLGSLQSACEALIEKDGTRLLQVLTNEVDGNELCHMFGLCPKKSLLLNGLSLQDDPSKCKRCVQDFTRRKHIAEKLVNHSSEFLHHLCGQLPQKDDCVKSVDDSINELVTFIRSLDPRDICIQLNMCDQQSLRSIRLIDIHPSENTVNEEILEYIKNDVCNRAGSLSSLCLELADSEGLNLLNLVAKTIDPHQICNVIDICPSSLVMANCHDKCQCCTNKVEIYQRQLEKFIRTIVASTRLMCDHVSGRDMCLRLADVFESNVDKVVGHFDSQHTCQLLNLCKLSEKETNKDECQTCKNELYLRENRLRTTIQQVTMNLLSLCKDEQCRSSVRSTERRLLDSVVNLDSETLCQRLGYCKRENVWESSSTLLRLRKLVQRQTKTLEERLQSHNICSEFGQLKSMCEQLMISEQSSRYAYVYKALLTNNRKLVDDDLREQMSTKITTAACDSCKNAVQSSKDFWVNAAESVRSALLRTCDYCPSKDECRDYTNRRFDDIKSYVNDIDPEQFCETIHLCSTLSIDRQKIPSTLCANMGVFQQSCEEALQAFSHSLQHDSQTFEQHLPDTSVVVLPTESAEEEERDSNSTCIMCENVMNMLSTYIHEKSTEDEIEQSLQKVCTQMPAPLRGQCHELIDNYGPAIIATLINRFDVGTICRRLNLCTSQMKVDLSHMTKANAASCGVCDYVSTYVDFALKRDSSDKSLERALSTVCTHLSNEQVSHCQTLVNLVRPNIRQLQLQFGNNFCKQLPLCQTPMSELKPALHLNRLPLNQESDEEDTSKQVIEENLDSTPQCMLCHYVVSYLDAALKNNKSEAEVQAALAKVCTILPRKERVNCAEFVHNYGPVLAQLITELADPALICRYLGMCQAVLPQESIPMTDSHHHFDRIPV